MTAGADVERVKREVEEIIGLDCSDAIQCSAKMVGVLPPNSAHDHTLPLTWRSSAHMGQHHQPSVALMSPPRHAQGIGIQEILEAVVQRVPPPAETLEEPLRALIFDSYYDPYKANRCTPVLSAGSVLHRAAVLSRSA